LPGNTALAGNADPLLSRSQARFESVAASAMALDAISAPRHDAMDDPKSGVPMRRPKLSPIHPGEILREEFLVPLGISQYRVAKETSVAPRRINEIVRGTRAITADTALRLSRYFGTSERFWLNLQMRYDLELEKDRLGDRLGREVKVCDRASSEGGS
jgi:antitoxin HigA-1